MKCNPLAFWEFRDCFNYTDVNGLDIHPLHGGPPFSRARACSPPQRRRRAWQRSGPVRTHAWWKAVIGAASQGEADAAPISSGPGRPGRRWLAAVRDAGSCTVVL